MHRSSDDVREEPYMVERRSVAKNIG